MNKKIAALAIALVVVFGVAAWWAHRLADARNRAPDFTLTDQNGHPFKLDQERGRAVALFFGYTHCPDVCPLALAHLASARKSLGTNGEDVQVVFITVDPQHDTPSQIKTYLDKFDPSFIGLTGTEAQLAPVYRAYHVWYQALPKTKKGLEALEEHTATITIIDRNGHLKSYADQADTVTALAQFLRAASS